MDFFSIATISILRFLQDSAMEKGFETSLVTQAANFGVSAPKLNVSIYDFGTNSRVPSRDNHINLQIRPLGDNEGFLFVIQTHWDKEKEPHIRPLDGFFDYFEYGSRNYFLEENKPDWCIRMFSENDVLRAFSDCLKRAECIGYGLNDKGQIIDLRLDY